MTLPIISNPQVENISHTTVVNMGGATDIPQSQALNGIKALSKMSSLTIRNAKFQNGAQYEIIWPFLTIRNGKLEVVEVSKYFVKEDKKQNTITVYSKFSEIYS